MAYQQLSPAKPLLQPLLQSLNNTACTTFTTTEIRHRVSTSTRWHSTFRLCCHSNETHAPIANPPNSAQLEGTPYHSLK